MKKLIITAAIVLGLNPTTFANPNGGGVFGRGETNNREGNELFAPKLPAHGQNTNLPAPIGSGIVVLTAFGAAYLIGKHRKEE